MAATTRQMSETKVFRLQDLMEIHGEFLVTHQCHHSHQIEDWYRKVHV